MFDKSAEMDIPEPLNAPFFEKYDGSIVPPIWYWEYVEFPDWSVFLLAKKM
jgi:hypothetical protein